MNKTHRSQKNINLSISAFKKIRLMKTVREIAEHFKITEPAVRRWEKKGPPFHAIEQLERLVDKKVTRYQLWPELKDLLK